MIKLERILVPTDFSACSQPALDYGCALAQRYGAELHLLHVVQPITSIVAYSLPISEELQNMERLAEQQLQELSHPAFAQLKQVVRAIRPGAPFVEIVGYAKGVDIDLIVLGTHGRSGLIHAMLGSVAEKVVRKAPCPVLTVRPKGHQFVMP